MRKEEMRSRPAPRVPLTNGAFDNDHEERPGGEGRKGGRGCGSEDGLEIPKQMRMQDRNLAGPYRQKTMADAPCKMGNSRTRLCKMSGSQMPLGWVVGMLEFRLAFPWNGGQSAATGVVCGTTIDTVRWRPHDWQEGGV